MLKRERITRVGGRSQVTVYCSLNCLFDPAFVRTMYLFACVIALLVTCTAVEVKQRELPPGALNMGYVSQCEADQVVKAVSGGLNVLYWFSIDLVDAHGSPSVMPSAVQPLPNVTCIVEVAKRLREMNLPTVHMVTVGGWGAPDPVITFPAQDMWAAWKSFNAEVEAAGLPGGFDGIDWDMEGANDPAAPSNLLAIGMLDLVGEMSQLAKKEGYIVSIVPPESYLDCTTNKFDNSLLHSYAEWEPIVDFKYHGRNAYAYLLAKYGTSTFDVVTIQLYESYTHLLYNMTQAPHRQTAAQYLIAYIPKMLNGWEIDFASFPEASLASQQLSIKKTQLVIGLGNGWVSDKNALVMPDQAQTAYETLKALGQEPRGFAFWSVENEGKVPPGQTEPLYLASGLNDFLHIRA